MKNSILGVPGSWLLLDLILDSFIYNNNFICTMDIHEFVKHKLMKLESFRLYDYDRVNSLIDFLYDSKQVDFEYSSDGYDFYKYYRNDLRSIPSKIYG